MDVNSGCTPELSRECLKNTDLVADLCDDVDMPWHEPELPKIDIPNSYKNSAEYLRELVWQGYQNKGMNQWPQEKQDVYKSRVEEELYVIEKKDFCDYFHGYHFNPASLP